MGGDFMLPIVPMNTETFSDQILSLPLCPFTEESEVRTVCRELIAAEAVCREAMSEPVMQ